MLSYFHISTKVLNGESSDQAQDFSQQCIKLRQHLEHKSDHHDVQYVPPSEQELTSYIKNVSKLHQEFKENMERFGEQDEKELIECWLSVFKPLIGLGYIDLLSKCFGSIYELDFTKCTEIRSEIFHMHSAFITKCAMNNNNEKRDEEIKKLYDYYHSGRFGPIITTPRLENVWQFPNFEGSFMRDKFLVKNSSFCLEEPKDIIVMVNEFFDLLGECAIKNVFVGYDRDFNYLYRFSIGSYQSTHEVVKECNTMKLLDNERAYHLDLYYKDGQRLYGICQGPSEGVSLPFYDQTRQGIVDLLAGSDFDLETCCNK